VGVVVPLVLDADVGLAEVLLELELSSTITPPPACEGSTLEETFAAADLNESRVCPELESLHKIVLVDVYGRQGDDSPYGALITPTMPDSQWLDSGQYIHIGSVEFIVRTKDFPCKHSSVYMSSITIHGLRAQVFSNLQALRHQRRISNC
jgi:hypothetical protein